METIVCDLCGSKELLTVYEMPDILYFPNERFSVSECLGCGLGFTNPRPSRSEIGKYYPSAFFQYFDQDWHRTRYQREAEYLKDIAADGAALLDVGCANGDFPRHMRALGWQVVGVEIGEAAREINDFPVHRCEFSEAPIQDCSVDAVTAWAVIEHVHSPSAYFAKSAAVLKPGGRLVFLVTNFQSWSSRYLYREDLPRHLYFFTEETVKRFMEAAGLKLVRADYTNKIYELRPVNWLRLIVYRYLLRKPLLWDDLPERPVAYFARIGRSDWLAKVSYVLGNPFAVLDKLLMPFFELFGPKRITRGVVVFVAEKPRAKNR